MWEDLNLNSFFGGGRGGNPHLKIKIINLEGGVEKG